MKLIAGLGNPGRQYDGSRHNVGFAVADELARRWRIELTYSERFEGLLGEAMVGTQRTLLLKPATYMNLSGRSVGAVARFYKLAVNDVLLIYDELDLPLGELRVRAGGSAGGHRGMQDVLTQLSAPDVARIRIGIGKVHRSATVEHVLGRFAPDEREPAAQAVLNAADAASCWLTHGISSAMNQFNKRRADAPRRASRKAADDAGPSQGDPV